jgi:hypothetical protein
MKTICRLPDFEVPNVSLYLYSDDTPISVESDRTVIGDPANPSLYILDCTTSNCVLHEGVSEPLDWYGWKYTYTDEDGWELNPKWEPPIPPPQ